MNLSLEHICKSWRILSQQSWYMKTLDLSPSTWGIATIYISSFMLNNILSKCGQFLTQIDLSGFNDNVLLAIIGKSCPNVMKINANGIITTSEGLKLLAENCKNIVKLSLGPSLFSLEEELKELFEKHKNLEHLSIRAFRTLGKCLLHLPIEKLHTFKVRNCLDMDNIHVSAVLKRLDKLKCLEIIDCNIVDDTLLVISTYCVNLRVLKLTCLLTISNEFCFTHLSNLQVIKIGTCLSDTHFLDMVSHCQQLISVDITGSHSVTDVGLQTIATLPKLEKLVLDMTTFTDRGLKYLHGLKELHCQFCPNITDEGILSVIMASPQLQLLDLTACLRISVDTLPVAKQVCNNRSNKLKLTMIVVDTLLCSFLPVGETIKICRFLELKT